MKMMLLWVLSSFIDKLIPLSFCYGKQNMKYYWFILKIIRNEKENLGKWQYDLHYLWSCIFSYSAEVLGPCWFMGISYWSVINLFMSYFIPIVQVNIVSLIVKLIIFKWLPYFVWPHIWFVLSYDPWTWILIRGSRIQLLMWLDMGSLRSDSCRSSRAKVYTRRSKSLGLLV